MGQCAGMTPDGRHSSALRPLAGTPPGQRGLNGHEGLPDLLAKSVTIARFVVAGRWACGIDATSTLCVRSFQTRVLRTRATRHNGRDEPEGEKRHSASVDHRHIPLSAEWSRRHDYARPESRVAGQGDVIHQS